MGDSHREHSHHQPQHQTKVQDLFADHEPDETALYQVAKWHLNDRGHDNIRILWNGHLKDLDRGSQNIALDSVDLPVCRFDAGTVVEFQRRTNRGWESCDDPRRRITPRVVEAQDMRPNVLLVDADEQFWTEYRGAIKSSAKKSVLVSTVRDAKLRFYNGVRFDAVVVNDLVDDGSTEGFVRMLRANGWRGLIIVLSESDEAHPRFVLAGATKVHTRADMAGFFHTLFSRQS